MITLGSYYISEDDVQGMAKCMREITGPKSMLGEFLVGCAGPYATVAMLAAALSANAQSKTEVLYAADHNMRVLVEIEDAEVHTSYSTVITFTAVE